MGERVTRVVYGVTYEDHPFPFGCVSSSKWGNFIDDAKGAGFKGLVSGYECSPGYVGFAVMDHMRGAVVELNPDFDPSVRSVRLTSGNRDLLLGDVRGAWRDFRAWMREAGYDDPGFANLLFVEHSE